MGLFERLLIDSNYIAPSNVELGILSDLIAFIGYQETYERDFIFSNNWVEVYGRGFIFHTNTTLPGAVATEYSIYGNLLFGGRNSQVITYASGSEINFTQNTILADGRGGSFAAINPIDYSYVSFNFERNIIESGYYGLVTTNWTNISDLVGELNWNWQDNIVVMGNSTFSYTFPNNTMLKRSLADIGFVDMDNKNYNLLPSSPYSAENYGVQLGVDVCLLINTAKIKIGVPGCILEGVDLQPNEIIEITDIIAINGNLTLYPNSTLQVTFGDGKVNVSNCANFDGLLSLANMTNVENGTEVLIAYYGCRDGEFSEILLLNDEQDPCLQRYVNLTYSPTRLTAIFTSLSTCGDTTTTESFPDWAIAVIVVGSCVILVVIFIVLSVTVPSLRKKVYPYAHRGK